MDSQQLLYIIILILVFLGALFWTARRKPDRPTKLNVKAGERFDQKPLPEKPDKPKDNQKIIESPPSLIPPTRNEKNETHAQQRATESSTWLEPDLSTAPQTPTHAKNLSIFFMYNGHDWEAHDVLGIPQGASLVVATEMYQKLLKKEDPSTFEFYESAYNAILQKRKKERL